MRQVYWQPRHMSRSWLCALAALAVGAVVVVEVARAPRVEGEALEEALRAARRTAECFEVVRRARLELGIAIDPLRDPTEQGLIGAPLTSVTSVWGSLASKQTSCNPNWSAVIVDELRAAGVERGERVAVAFSGSFPALNMATCVALDVLGAEAVIVSSAASSQWGANHPELLWIDMERLLHAQEAISTRSLAVSLGGHGDTASELSDEGRAALRAAIERNGYTPLEHDSVEEAVAERIALYAEAAEGRPDAAFVNVGGGVVATGGEGLDDALTPGLSRGVPAELPTGSSVAQHFLSRGVPMLHLSHIKDLARLHGLPLTPQVAPAVGSGGVFERSHYDLRLAWAGIVLLVCGLHVAGRARVGRGAAGAEPLEASI